jgi:hypothetical protein
MDQATIQSYQPGGTIYAQLQTTYGTDGANTIAAAALTGDESQVNAAITQVQYGNPLNTSTGDAFISQVTTDPLAAPLADVNTIVQNSINSLENSLKGNVQNLFTNPYVLVAAGVILFLALGGTNVIKNKISKL